jgi:hypothetical protein
MAARIVLVLAFLTLAIAPAVSAQAPPPPPDWTVSLAGRVWVTSGWSNWNFKSAGVDPASDLRWRGVDAVVGEVAADVVWRRWVWMISIGGSSLDQGTLVDEDFAQSNRQKRFSVTRSPVDSGSIFYVNNDIGVRAVRWQQPLFGPAPAPSTPAGYVDVFVGYQFWREEYSAFGAQGSLILAPNFVVNQFEPGSVKFVTHEYTRHSVRIGARTQVPIVGGLSLKGLVAISPYTHTDHEDTHYLRTDLRNPIVSSANGGFGVQGEIGLAYAVWRGLSAEAGFRYWRFDSGQGDVVSRAVNGTEGRARLDEAITERYGPYLGVSWRF